MASTPDPPAEGLLGGFADYAIGDVIGDGLAGKMRAGRYLPSGLEVTIEEMPTELVADSEFRKRLVSECHLASSLRHPAVIAVYDVLEERQRVAVVAELAAGTSLLDALKNGTLSAPAVLLMANAVLLALEAAHHAGVVHGALSAAAVLLCPDGTANLGGLGVGRATRPEV
ncbi:MAG: protein kinase, partial [Candidatus Dormibacteraeota bacterium]|nr:protein kinase [Candidatus Dormibacteraeota bacterium]